MSQRDEFRARQRPPPKKHHNLYLCAEKREKLEHLKMIDRDKILEEIRRAAEDAIERRWRQVCAVSGTDPNASPGSPSLIPRAPVKAP
ncbi:MAG: hypothetical protein HC883_00010 [Bdellovibrionaceae bacterium]|nr:hypothetical protein [Pseudobdellovibrionaceae bacterium]